MRLGGSGGEPVGHDQHGVPAHPALGLEPPERLGVEATGQLGRAQRSPGPRPYCGRAPPEGRPLRSRRSRPGCPTCGDPPRAVDPSEFPGRGAGCRAAKIPRYALDDKAVGDGDGRSWCDRRAIGPSPATPVPACRSVPPPARAGAAGSAPRRAPPSGCSRPPRSRPGATGRWCPTAARAARIPPGEHARAARQLGHLPMTSRPARAESGGRPRKSGRTALAHNPAPAARGPASRNRDARAAGSVGSTWTGRRHPAGRRISRSRMAIA